MKIALLKLASIVAILILCYGFYLYSTQEDLLFRPKQLSQNFNFNLDSVSQEINLRTKDNVNLNSLIVRTENSKGLVFFLHGNSGSNADWSKDYEFYQGLGYDYIVTDYRGFGKSTGVIANQQEVLSDALLVFDDIAKYYKKKEIVVVGYSFGTTVASYIASKRKVSKLVLLSPFYSLINLKKHVFPIFPTFMLKYDFETYKYLDNVRAPILIFHGNDDRLIGIESSLMLKKHLKKNDEFIVINKQGHVGITNNPAYKERMIKEL